MEWRFGMKKCIILLVGIVLALSGCSQSKKATPYFNATVLEVYENSVLVTPFEGEEELKSSDEIVVSTSVESPTIEVPKMEEGTCIRIMYNGEIAESYPAQIHTVFAIYLVDENGEIIE